MWREDVIAGKMDNRKICPVMSRPQGIVLCQGKNCAAAYPRNLMGETLWYCEIIEGHPSQGEGVNER